MITTRNNQDYPQGVLGPGYNNNYRLFDIRQLLQSYPPEAVIFVHGWGIDVNKAQERLDRVKMSMEHNKYNISLIGLSWDSNGDWEPAKSIAKQNANNHFKIPSVHLMGAAIDDEEVSQDPLDVSSDTSNINSVKFAYGKPIQEEVARFYNLFNPGDNVLQPHPFYPVDIFTRFIPILKRIRH